MLYKPTTTKKMVLYCITYLQYFCWGTQVVIIANEGGVSMNHRVGGLSKFSAETAGSFADYLG